MSSYPAARRSDIVDVLHGTPVADPYRWLEDPTAPETIAWSAAQDELCQRHLASYAERAWFEDKLRALTPGSLSHPTVRGERLFFSRREIGQDHAVLYVRDGTGDERALIDPNALDPDGTTTLDATSANKDGTLLAYQLSTGGDEESVLHVLDVATGAELDLPIDRCRYSAVAWEADGKAFYYSRYLAPDEAPDAEYHLHRRVYRHVVGQDPSLDELVTGGTSERGTYWGLDTSHDGRWLVVSSSVGTAPRNDVWLADLHTDRSLREVQIGLDASTGAWVERDGRLWLHTDLDAPNWRLAVTDVDQPEPANWVDVIAADADAVMEQVAILDDAIAVAWIRDVVGEVTIHELDGTLRRKVSLPGAGAVTISSPPEGGTKLFIAYADFVDPGVVLVHDVVTGETSEWGRSPGQVIEGVISRQVFVTSPDGTRVPAFVIESGTAAGGPRPTVLYGYGGFNVAMTPAYSAGIAAWAAGGGTYVIANLRGGSEYGEAWHRAGMRGQKQNVFDDFHAVATWICTEGISTPSQLAISGGSNGGLLVGAALTQWPALFAAVVCSAPLLDMIRYELFGLGETWNDEYGTVRDPEEFRWLLGYSPYHRVVDGVEYPAVLFTLFDSDSRVDPLHGRKLCAALQAATSGDPGKRPILLRREKDVGHGARSVARDIALRADTAAFLAHHTGLAPGR